MLWLGFSTVFGLPQEKDLVAFVGSATLKFSLMHSDIKLEKLLSLLVQRQR